MNEIRWADTLAFGSDLKSRGYYEGGSFMVRFFPTATGRSISLRHNDEFVGAFKTVGAAKRRARQIATGRKAVQS
jgi:hypothetical protein